MSRRFLLSLPLSLPLVVLWLALAIVRTPLNLITQACSMLLDNIMLPGQCEWYWPSLRRAWRP
jgi:hypothetical protein